MDRRFPAGYRRNPRVQQSGHREVIAALWRDSANEQAAAVHADEPFGSSCDAGTPSGEGFLLRYRVDAPPDRLQYRFVGNDGCAATGMTTPIFATWMDNAEAWTTGRRAGQTGFP